MEKLVNLQAVHFRTPIILRVEQMHIDARTLENNAIIDADICIVGTGAAGTSLALEWIGTSHKVVVLEAGGFDFDADTQKLNEGYITGRHYFPLSSTRLRFFGGTTGHWMGFCSPFDPIDFKKRDWVPYSGWPISRKDLDPFYERAHPIVDLGPFEWEASDWEDKDAGKIRYLLLNVVGGLNYQSVAI